MAASAGNHEALGTVECAHAPRGGLSLVCRRLAGLQPARVRHFDGNGEPLPVRATQERQAGTRLSRFRGRGLLGFALPPGRTPALLVPAPPQKPGEEYLGTVVSGQWLVIGVELADAMTLTIDRDASHAALSRY